MITQTFQDKLNYWCAKRAEYQAEFDAATRRGIHGQADAVKWLDKLAGADATIDALCAMKAEAAE